MTINITRMKELDDILNIMEPDADITDEQLEQLAGDADLRTAAEDIAIARSILTPEPDKDEVNARLKTFKVAHPDSSRYAEPDAKRKTHLIWLLLTATAAVVAGMIWILQKPVHNEDPSLLFQADATIGARITDKAGNIVPLMAHDDGSVDAVIKVKDYATNIDILEHDTLMLSLSQGQSYRVDLPDGSKVYLHPGSRLLYPTAFGQHSRDVKLSGEGYFVIAKDVARPFHIITDRSVTSVLGTEFYLSSCKESDESLVLVNGKVRFRKKTDETSVDVSPGQEAVLNQYGYIDVHPADTMQYTSWRDGFIYYDRASLDEILKQIGAIYNVTVHCYNRNLLSLHMHFVLRRDQNLNDAVEMLNSMKKVHATLRGSTLIIR